jgi:DNA repair exonuclease SbcCD ATPase subunit
MSSIDKLAVRGIRSFSPFDEEKIEFYKPLTLILGQNGAGKTVTILLIMTYIDYHRKFAYNDLRVYAPSHPGRQDLHS